LVTPQIFTRTTTRLLLPGRYAEELDERSGRIGSEHQVLANEKRVEAGFTKFLQIVVGAEAGFADGDAIVRDAFDQFERSLDADVERLEVAVVDTDDAAAYGEGAAEFLGRVNFHERLHSKLTAEGDEVAKRIVAQHGGHEQEAVRIVRASFPDLPGIEDKILAENGKIHGFSSVAEIFQRAAKKFRFGEDGERNGARGFERGGQGGRIERLAQHTVGRGSRLELGEDVESMARKRSGKVANRRGRFDPVFQCRFGQYFFAVFDLGAARLENAVEDGSGGGMGIHAREKLCYGDRQRVSNSGDWRLERAASI